MTTEREEALELARDVGLETRTLNSIDPDEIVVDQVIITDEIERLVRLAKQRGADELSGNARIVELEDAIINANDGLLDGEGVPLTYYMRNGKYKDLIASVTAPSQPTTLPE